MALVIELSYPAVRGSGIREGTFTEAQALVQEALLAEGYEGNWLLRADARVTWRATNKMRWLSGRSHAIRLCVKPKGNDTAWEYNLVPPHQYSAQSVLDRMRQKQLPLPDEAEDIVTLPSPNGTPGPIDPMAILSALQTAVTCSVERQQLREQKEARQQLLREDIASAQEEINKLDAEILAIMAEEEGDARGRKARDILGALGSFVNTPERG